MVLNSTIPTIFIDDQPYFDIEKINEWIKEYINHKDKQSVRVVGDMVIDPKKREKLEYMQGFECERCEYVGEVEVYNDDTIHGIVDKIKRKHSNDSPDCENNIQDIVIARKEF
jgi:hypothetical protein